MKVEPKVLYNFVACQAGWFACVLGGAHGLPLVGVFAVVAIVGVHLALARRAGPEALLIGAAAVIGLVWDSALVALGLMSYTSGTVVPGLAPPWIVAMWALFASSLNLSMGWLKGRPLAAAVFGAIGGPLAYLAGARLGALQMPEPVLALGAQAVGWGILLPLLAWLAARLNGFEGAARAGATAPVSEPAR